MITRDKIISTIRDHIERAPNASSGGTYFDDKSETIYQYVDIGELDLGKIADDILDRTEQRPTMGTIHD